MSKVWNNYIFERSLLNLGMNLFDQILSLKKLQDHETLKTLVIAAKKKSPLLSHK